MTTRTTSGVLAVVAGLLVVPGGAQAADLSLPLTSTTETTTQPTTTESLAPTTTLTAPTTTAIQPPPTTTEDAPPATTETTPSVVVPAPRATKPDEKPDASAKSEPKKKTSDSPSDGKSGRAAKRRGERAKAKAAKAAAKKQAKEEAAQKKADAAKKKAEDEAAAANPDGTTTDVPGDIAANDADISSDVGSLLDEGLVAQVPNFFISQFKIPPFLLPIYQAAGIQYGIRWEILAAINEIETDYGRNLNISSAGAQGWMQFMPATWQSYGVDANGDSKADPYNPVDAIFSAARYLKAAGSDTDIRKAIFAYNHADWYVNSVIARARLISVLPTDLIGSLSGLTQGIFPVAGKASYVGAKGSDNETLSTTDDTVRSAELTGKAGADAIAVQDGTITAIGESVRLGKFVQLRDVYGNRYTYAHLDSIAQTYSAPVESETEEHAPDKDADPAKDPAPREAATAGRQPVEKKQAEAEPAKPADKPEAKSDDAGPTATDRTASPDGKERAFANPDYAAASVSPTAPAPGDLAATDPSTVDSHPRPTMTPEVPRVEGEGSQAAPEGSVRVPLRKGSRVVSGTKLGTIASEETYEATQRARAKDGATVETGEAAEDDASSLDGRMTFEVRPAGKGAPRIDPRPILEGWKLLQTSSVYGASGKDALFGGGVDATAGQVLLLSKAQLQQRVLADENIEIYEVGRGQIKAGLVDRRVLATLAYLSASGRKLTISSLSRPGSITSSGNVSDHSSGNAIDIASVDGQVISSATQGKGSITDDTIRLLLRLQGTIKPHQIISLMPPSDFGGAENILALPDHDDHIHVGFPYDGDNDPVLGQQLASALKPGQWDDLISRLGKISNPKVSAEPSKYALKVKKSKRGSSSRK